MAAPVEFTVTSVRDYLYHGVVAPPTAHQVTAIRAFARFVTFASLRAERSLAQVLRAEVWTRSQVDQIIHCESLVLPKSKTVSYEYAKYIS